MKRVTYLYGWKASSEIVDDWIFDEIANKFVLDEKMKVFFQENNPYALEEISRRLLEANTRGLWNCNKKLLNNLKHSYIKTEP
ncbi:cobaltochelatase subunit CobN [Methanobrevibacter oralis]|uniref:cobaltochelatase subunit CobN n=1 Tax=Methanobrevibacter oralis TaxID=66851 RepID=UPI001C7362F5|nr:cobaltochelatase subunit CobN [Methanobrevibacter oralis]